MTDMSRPDDPLPLTGERTVPGIPHENYWFRRHEIVYLEATSWLFHGSVVLDVGCGEGYGTALLAGQQAKVIGVDYDPMAAAHAARRYRDIRVVRANAVALPCADNRVDAVFGLQVIEHLWDQPGFLRECRRVLRPDGVLMLSTPNRLTFSRGLERPLNPCHTREFDPDELTAALNPHFIVERIFGLHHGHAIAAWERHAGGVVDAQLAAPPHEWPDELYEFVSGVTVEDFFIDRNRLDESLDLIVLARPGPAGRTG
jgi:SAM-dependent methyltransferase